ncbi:MAG: hypothetical protein KKC03_02250 [Bacteroidetes bacterium]|nr:hypothetical protein [Bacteroidota bacterium]
MNFKSIFFGLLMLSLYACSGSGSDEPIENEVPLQDVFNFLIISDKGELHAVGNNSAHAKKVGNIEGVSDFILLNNFTLNNTHIYKSLQEFNEVPEFFMLVYNRASKTTEKHKLHVPTGIEAPSPSLFNLAWSEQGVYALLVKDIDIQSPFMHLVKVNVDDYTLTDLGIQVPFKEFTSMELLNNSLYLSTWNAGIWQINLSDGEAKELLFNGESIGGSRLAAIDNNRLAFMKSHSFILNAATPVELNLLDQTYIAKGSLDFVGLVDVMGKGYYDISENEYINIITSNTLNVINGLLKTNFRNNTEVYTELKGFQSSNRNLIVLDKLPL